MSEADDRLRSLFAADAPAARDAVFVAETMSRVHKRRLQQEVAGLAVTAALGGLGLWAVWPLLAPVATSLARDLAPAAAALAIAACAGLLTQGPARIPLQAAES